jgi:hypothetical protein
VAERIGRRLKAKKCGPKTGEIKESSKMGEKT